MSANTSVDLDKHTLGNHSRGIWHSSGRMPVRRNATAPQSIANLIHYIALIGKDLRVQK
jgi:hypothetical protein